MKKLFLFVAVAAMAFSCSSDDDNGGSSADSVSFKFDGASKNLTNVIVEEDTEGEDTYVSVTANIGTSTDNVVNFATYRGDVGSDAIFGFSFLIDGVMYFDMSGGLNVVVQTNNSNTLKGSFSGTVVDMEGNEHTVTDGSFNIKY